MSTESTTVEQLRLDEGNHGLKLLHEQLAVLGWAANFTRMVFPVLESEGESAVESKGERQAKNARKIREVLESHEKNCSQAPERRQSQTCGADQGRPLGSQGGYMSNNQAPVHIRLDDRSHVEKPLLEQCEGITA